MKTELMFPRKAHLVVSVAVFAAVCLALVGVSARSTRKSPPMQETPTIQIRNYTKAFKVVSTETIGEDFVISLKNVSEKAISAYTWSLGPSNHPTDSHDADGAVSGQVISPGTVHKVEIPLIAFVHSAETAPSHQPIFNFVAVLFDDHTSEGLPSGVQELKDWRTGERIQLRRIKRLLEEIAGTDDLSLPARLNDLGSRISELSEMPETDQSDSVGQGLLSAKRHAAVLLDHLKSEHGGMAELSGPSSRENARKVVTNLIQQTDIWLSRY